MARYTMGIDAGGTKVAYGLFDAAGKLLRRFEHPTDAQADGPAFTDQLVDTAYHMLEAERIGPEDLEGIGVCMPSFILYDQGYIYLTSAMTNIRDFPMRDYISARLPTRVVLDNDGNVAALAEHRHGAGKGSRHMVYIAASTGIGSGIIIDGKVFHGSYGWGGNAAICWPPRRQGWNAAAGTGDASCPTPPAGISPSTPGSGWRPGRTASWGRRRT